MSVLTVYTNAIPISIMLHEAEASMMSHLSKGTKNNQQAAFGDGMGVGWGWGWGWGLVTVLRLAQGCLLALMSLNESPPSTGYFIYLHLSFHSVLSMSRDGDGDGDGNCV